MRYKLNILIKNDEKEIIFFSLNSFNKNLNYRFYFE